MNLYLKVSELVKRFENNDTGIRNYGIFNKELIKIVIEYILDRE